MPHAPLLDPDASAAQISGALELPLGAMGAVLLTHAAKARLPLGFKTLDGGHYVWANTALIDLYARPADDVIGHTDAELLPAAAQAAFRQADLAAQAQPAGVVHDHRLELTSPNGTVRREFSVMRMVLSDAAGEPRYLCSLWNDRTDFRQRDAQLRTALEQLEGQQRANEALRRELQSEDFRDPATGLYSAGYFEDQLRREVDLSAREHREFALVDIGLDAPSAAVQAHGDEGRRCILEALGRQVRSNTRAMDTSCRIGESRFAVLLSGVGLATAHARMENLRRQCGQQMVMLRQQELGLTVSMGVASFPHTAEHPAGLLNAAAKALAEATRRGGNQVVLASISFDTRPVV